MIYADFESILGPEEDVRWRCVQCFGEDVYNLINSMLEQSKCCSDVRKKKILSKNLLWLNNMMKISRTLLNTAFVIMILLMWLMLK